MSPDPFVRSTFNRARRQEAYRKLARVLRDEDTQPLIPLDEVSSRLRVFEQGYVGIRPIPVGDIVGTVSRTGDFDRDFLPRRREIAERWKRVEEAHPEGEFPPIQVYEVDGRYFVVDGHHRVAVAKQRGVDFIDAEITRLRTRWPLPPDADIRRIIMAEQERIFMDESGLQRAYPEVRIEFTRPQGYIELLEQIQIHGYHLMMERGTVLSHQDVARHWYDRVYLPGIQAIGAEGLRELWPKATEPDLYLWVHQHRRELFPERRDIGFEEVARDVKEWHKPGERPQHRRGKGSRD